MAIIHRDRGVTIYLTSRPTWHIFYIFRQCPCLCRFIIDILGAGIGAFTLTAAIDAQTNQTTSDIDSCILVDVTVLTTTIDSTHDAIIFSPDV